MIYWNSFLNRKNCLKWFSVFILLFSVYSFIYALYSDKYQTGGNAYKYDISAEIFQRLLFTGGVQTIDNYSIQVYGDTPGIVENGHGSAITDERPLYFLFLSVIKLFGTFPLGINYFVNMLFLLASIVLLSKVLFSQNSVVFVVLGGLLFSPLMVYYSFIFEPHIFEIFLTASGIYFYKKEQWFWSFLILTLTVSVHGGNLVLLGCIGIYHIYTHFKNSHAIIAAVIGGIVGWICIELFLFVLFVKDQLGIIPHDYMLQRLLLKSSRMSGDYAKVDGFFYYWQNAAGFLPLATVGIFWIKNKFQFAVTLAPLIIFAIVGRFGMPIYRVVLPVFFLGYCFFWYNFLTTKYNLIRWCGISLLSVAVLSSFSYYFFVYNCQSIKEKEPVSIDSSFNGVHSSFTRQRLFWNLKRFNSIKDNANIIYNLKKISVYERPNIPSPRLFYKYAVSNIFKTFLPEKMTRKMGFTVTPSTLRYRLVRQKNLKINLGQE